MKGDVSAALADHVAVITFDRAPNNNVDPALLSAIADALEMLDKDPACRAVVLQSNGKPFCAGADLSSESKKVEDLARGPLPDVNPLYVQAARLYATRKPIVVALQGAAVGAGLGLALIGDFRVAAAEARLVANFTQLGFHPGFGLSHTLPRLVGHQRAAHILLRGARLTADEALAIGLVDKVTDGPSLRGEALALATELANNAPLVVQSTRATLRAELARAVEAQTRHEWGQQREHLQTADASEGVRAMIERRPPVFIGR